MGGGRVADGHVGVPPIDGGDEAAVGSGRSGVPGEGATGAKVGGDRLPGADDLSIVVVEFELF